MTGDEMYALAQQIYPHRRSLTGAGVRATLRDLQKIIPLTINEVPSGTKAFDWIVPPEWNVGSAWVEDIDNRKTVIDWEWNALHLIGYSEPIDKVMTFDELDKHLYSLPDQPKAIPHVTSYYERDWGFCLEQKRRRKLDKKSHYHVVVNTALDPNGSLTYGEMVIPGETPDEVLLSTYICHPPMGNNEVSGIVVTTALAKWVMEHPRRLTYRFVFVPETIGAIVYLSRCLDWMKAHTVAGYVVTCVGDNGPYSYLPSRKGDTLADRVAISVLDSPAVPYLRYSWADRGSDERQYCAPGVDLPVCSIMRSKYGTYPEYHTSLDDLTFISAKGLEGSFNILRQCLMTLEQNKTLKMVCLGEPQLGRRGLYPNLSTLTSAQTKAHTMDVTSLMDGMKDYLAIAEAVGVSFGECAEIGDLMLEYGLAEEV